MLFFRRRPREGIGPAADAAHVSDSRVVPALIRFASRRVAASGSCRVLLFGPPSGRTIEAFSSAGCRVTVEGERTPKTRLDYGVDTFDLLLVLDLLDFLDERRAASLASEWQRVLRPGGRIYMLSRQKSREPGPRLRVDIRPDAKIELHPMPGGTEQVRLRSNREIESLLAPLTVDEVHLRRDGLREIAGRKRETRTRV
jgi:SAM-dependent methyltransferase